MNLGSFHHPISRRNFLGLLGAGTVAVGSLSLLAACADDTSEDEPVVDDDEVEEEEEEEVEDEDEQEEEDTSEEPDDADTEEEPGAEVDQVDPDEATEALRFVWIGDMTDLWHPAAYHTFSQAVVFSLIFNNLVKIEEDLATVLPDLADDWEISDDATEFTFSLNPDASWHDGEPVTAEDVVFSFSRQIVEPYRFAKFMDDVVGAEAFENGDTDQVEGLEAIDESTVRITVNNPDVVFVNEMAEPGNVIVPKHLLEDIEPDEIESSEFAMDTPIGSGPYKFVQYVTDQYIEFEVNTEYFKGSPQINRVYMKRIDGTAAIAQLESGEVDLGLRLDPLERERLDGLDGVEAITVPGVGLTGLAFPTEQDRMSDPRIRQGVYCAIDRQSIVDAILDGAADVRNGNPASLDHYDGIDPYEYDPDRARSLLEEGGWDFDAPFRLMFDPNYPGASEYFPVIGEQLQAVGLNVELEPLDPAARTERHSEQRDTYEADAFHGGNWGSPPAIADYYDCSRDNWGAGYTNCDLDELFAEARTIVNEDERDEVHREIAMLLNEELPRIALWTPHDVHAATESLGGGFSVHPDARRSFNKVETWTLS